VGEYVIQVCNSIVCMVKGSQEIYDLCKKQYELEFGFKMIQ
jgi:NADH:ubiquinone oxidoreductase subunit E